MPEHTTPSLRRIVLLGSTGSIGTQTLDTIDHLNTLNARGAHPTRYQPIALAANSNANLLAAQAAKHNITHLALANPTADHAPNSNSFPATPIQGADSALKLVQSLIESDQLDPDTDLLVAAIVGSAGLPATLAAARFGLDIALANKETLVAAGPLVLDACRASGAKLLPVDSEHAALWHAIAAYANTENTPSYSPPTPAPHTIRRLILTASGGPFRDPHAWPKSKIQTATPDHALNHPTWSMGAKVTIDSASLTNKALELIEAHHLYSLPESKLDVLVHPQVIIHSLAEGNDGSLIAQLGPTDMRAPIQQALTFPLRSAPAAGMLDLAQLSTLTLEQPDHERFPVLNLARHVMNTGGSAGAIFNAANETAVLAFLAGAIPFGHIYDLTKDTLDALPASPISSLDHVLDADHAARDHVTRLLPSSATA